MKTTKLGVILACCFLLALMIALLVTALYHGDPVITVFADLEECKTLSKQTDAVFSAYEDVKLDKAVKDIRYSAFYAGEYSCDQYDFEIFAYTFESTEDARVYFKNTTGKKSEGMYSNFSVSSGFFTSRVVVFEENRAYSVSTKTANLKQVCEFLAGVFSREIT